MRRNIFGELEVRVGEIVKVEDFPEARKPAYKLWIDLGELGVKSSSCQVTRLYTKQELIGKQVVCVTNLPPLQVGPFCSEVLTNGCYRADGAVVLVIADKTIPNGSKLW